MMAIRELAFDVVGLAQTKGSARAFVIPGKGGARPRAIVTNDNPKAKGWQQTIANCAAIELQRRVHGGRMFEGAVALDVTFALPRPKKFLTPKYAGVAVPHVTRPDADKLLRVVKDALSRVAWHDDAQVTDVVVKKRYCAAGEFPRAIIRVREAANEEASHVPADQPALV